MLSLLRRLVTIGVTDDLEEPAARRIRMVNVATLVAALVGLTTTLLYVIWIDPASAAMGMAINAGFIVGYAAAIAANAAGRVDLAVWIGLSTGVVHIVGVTFFVGFDEGPAPFFLVIAVGAVILTRIEDRFTRWFFISVSVLGYITLSIVNPPAPETGSSYCPVNM